MLASCHNLMTYLYSSECFLSPWPIPLNLPGLTDKLSPVLVTYLKSSVIHLVITEQLLIYHFFKKNIDFFVVRKNFFFLKT